MTKEQAHKIQGCICQLENMHATLSNIANNQGLPAWEQKRIQAAQYGIDSALSGLRDSLMGAPAKNN